MFAIYHNRDLDGITSGAIIKLKYPDSKMIGYDYGEVFDIDEIAGEPIIMADVSFPMETMFRLAESSNWQLTWIDHHISAINAYKSYIGSNQSFCTAILEDGIAACEGVWKYLFKDKEMPISVKLIGEYDTRRNSDKVHWENEVLPLQFGLRSYCNSIESFPIEVLTNERIVSNIINEGKTILRYQSLVDDQQCKKAAFECEFEGYRAICLNGGTYNSDVFKSIYDESKHDLMISFQLIGKIWTVILFTTKDEVDCSLLAKNRGGGGHKKAAGFQVKNIDTVFDFLMVNDKEKIKI